MQLRAYIMILLAALLSAAAILTPSTLAHAPNTHAHFHYYDTTHGAAHHHCNHHDHAHHDHHEHDHPQHDNADDEPGHTCCGNCHTHTHHLTGLVTAPTRLRDDAPTPAANLPRPFNIESTRPPTTTVAQRRPPPRDGPPPGPLSQLRTVILLT